MAYQKVRFTSAVHGDTAGLVIDSMKLETMDVSEVSRLFPVSEFRKMVRLQKSPVYEQWESAFLHDFNR